MAIRHPRLIARAARALDPVVLVFCDRRATDAFVLQALLRSPAALLLAVKALAFGGVCAVSYADRVLFDSLDWVRFLMDPGAYVLGLWCLVACDFNRRAQLLRWLYFLIGVIATTVQLAQRFLRTIPSEQQRLITIGSTAFSVQDTLRMIAFTIELKLLECLWPILRRRDLVVFLDFHFTRRQLPVLLSRGFRSRMKRELHDDSLRHIELPSLARCKLSNQNVEQPTAAALPPSRPHERVRIAPEPDTPNSGGP